MSLKRSIIPFVLVCALSLFLGAQAQKQWKDRAEYDLYEAITKDNTPASRLQNLEKWKSGYPQSEYADVRLKIYLVTYQQMNNHRAAFDTASEILKTEPNDMQSLTEHVGYIRSLIPSAANAQLSAQNKADLETAEKTSRYILANLDTVYAADKKPQGTTDDQWNNAKPTMQKFSQFTVAYIANVQKDVPKAETELTKTLQLDPTNGQASYMLASVLLGQQKDHPEKMPAAIFQYARSAVQEGPGALDANTRKSVDAFFTKAYTTFHGSAEGIDAVRTLAKTNALPPAGFTIRSIVEIEKEKLEKESAAAAANPMLALFNSIKTALTGDGGPAYWDSSAKDADLPGGANGVTKFKGKLVSATPETNPKELTLAIAGETADVTIKLDEPLRGKMDPGGEISFSGVAKEYTKEPFMITFEVEPANIEGWTGKGPAPAPRPAGGAKKGVGKKK